jgi:CelD/BcsL family acetyltransferase involved in cellulose biosynthesis
VRLVHGAAGLEEAIAAYQTVYAASWKQPEPHVGFMPGLIRAAAGLGQLRMAIAWLQDQPVAAQVWMVAGGRADIYKLAHDEQHKETSPGSLLTALLMQHVFEFDGVKVVDYLSGDDGYKRLWMSEVRERRSLLAYKLRSARGLALAARASAAGLVKSVLPRRPAT